MTSLPEGRLTLVSGQPEMSADVVGAQTLYYAPDVGGTCPVVVTGALASQTFTSSNTDQVGLSLALAGSANWAADTLHDVFAIIDSGTLKLATRLWDSGMLPTEPQITNATAITTGTGGNAWVRTSAAFDGTLSQGAAVGARNTPGNSGLANFIGQDWGAGVQKTVSKVVVTAASDDNLRGDAATSLQVRVDGSDDNTNWVILDVRNINCSGALGQTFTIHINESNRTPYRYHRFGISGNGVSAINVAEVQFFNVVAPANGRRLTRFGGLLTNDATMTARTGASTTASVAVNEGTFLGVIHIDTGTNGQLTCHFEYGASRTFGVWNMYNQRGIILRAGIRTASPYTYNLSNIDWAAMQSSSTFSMQVLSGCAVSPVSATLARPVYIQAASNIAGYECGIGVDTTNSFTGTEASVTHDAAGQNIGHNLYPRLTLPPYAGMKTLYGVEKLAYAQSGTTSLFTDCRNTVLEAQWRG